ncbi:hypothetical protein FRC12_010388 [Ceratobasidium sp. 428]|nr:hypothetical protein FRC12_010388 [Ceratobasidium sp. 428]
MVNSADANADVRAARRQLNELGKFDDEGQPSRSEAEWRHEFLIATRDVDDKQRASLWADYLVYRGEAYQWLQAMKADPATKSRTEDWSTLEPLIEARWPTPVPDPAAYEESQRTRWVNSLFQIEQWSDMLCDPTNPTRPHQVWATQHRARGLACDSTNRDRVYHTLHNSLPPFVVSLLPKKYHYGNDFDELCKHIGEITSRELYDAWRDRILIESMGTLSVSGPPSSPAPTSTSVSVSSAPVSVSRSFSSSPYSSSPYSSSLARFRRQQPASTATSPAPAAATTPSTPRVSFRTETQVTQTPQPPPPVTPPAFANTIASSSQRQTPPHMPDPPAEPANPVLLPALPIVPDSSSDRARHKALVNEWEVKYGTSKPTSSNPFPLSPGTLQPGRGVCTRCGRGVHNSIECEAMGNEPLDGRERFTRGAYRTRQGRTGAPPSTPTPSSRVRNINQLDEVQSDEYATDYYSSGNE